MNTQRIKEQAANLISLCTDLDTRIRSTPKRYILCLHRVMTETEVRAQSIHHSMWVSPETLDNLLQWTQRIGEIVSLDEIMDFSKTHDKPIFCITFDDGWLDNYTLAFPILKKHNAPATIFVVTDAITTGNLFWVDEFVQKAAHLFHAPNAALLAWISEHTKIIAPKKSSAADKELMNNVIEALKTLSDSARVATLASFYKTFAIDPQPITGKLMDWSQVQAMAEAGISFQSHTHTHKILVDVDDGTMLYELTESKRIIEEKLDAHCDHFCFPNARFENDKAFLVGQAGYRFGFKIDNEPVTQASHPYLAPRMLVCENYAKNLNYFKLKLLGLPIYNRR